MNAYINTSMGPTEWCMLLVTLLIPATAILLGALFLDETLGAVHFVAMALIALGVSAIDGRLWRHYRARPGRAAE